MHLFILLALATLALAAQFNPDKKPSDRKDTLEDMERLLSSVASNLSNILSIPSSEYQEGQYASVCRQIRELDGEIAAKRASIEQRTEAMMGPDLGEGEVERLLGLIEAESRNVDELLCRKEELENLKSFI